MQVTTGEEQLIAGQMRDRIEGIHIILPMRELSEKSGGKWRTVTRVMLPGYLFIRLDEQRDATAIWHGVRRMDGVHRILGEMADADTARLRILANDGEAWGVSRCRWQDGQMHIYSGPLAGHEDWIIQYDRHRRRARIQIRIGEDMHQIHLGLIQD